MPITMLIVDDHELMRWALREWVKIKFPGCHVIEAVNAQEALTLAQAHLPQVVIMDVALPGMIGLQAMKQLRTLLPSTKVVVLTHHDDEVHRLQASVAGANAYLSKGRLASELQPTLAGLLLLPQNRTVKTKPEPSLVNESGSAGQGERRLFQRDQTMLDSEFDQTREIADT